MECSHGRPSGDDHGTRRRCRVPMGPARCRLRRCDRRCDRSAPRRMTGEEIRPSRLRWWWLAGALTALGAAGLVSVLLGAVDIVAGSVLLSIVDRLPFVHVDSGLTGRQEAILWELRMPRVVLGGIVGATLAVAGGAYQGSFRNPLADPYLLGVAAGAGLGATIAIAYRPAVGAIPIDPLPLLAFVG